MLAKLCQGIGMAELRETWQNSIIQQPKHVNASSSVPIFMCANKIGTHEFAQENICGHKRRCRDARPAQAAFFRIHLTRSIISRISVLSSYLLFILHF
jgi:hypothetical protein